MLARKGTVTPQNWKCLMPIDPSHEDLTSKLHTPGWRLVDSRTDESATGTLSEMLKESHSRKSRGEHPGKIEQIETAIELRLFQIEQLWQHLGLPTI